MRIKLLAAALIAATACAPVRTEKKPMTIQEWKGQHDGPAAAGSLVASDEDAWKSAWRQVGQDAPPLDFAKSVGVMVFVGQKPTGGWTVVFDAPVARGDDAVVRYHVPKPSGFTTQAFTQPWKAAAFPRPKGRLILEAPPE
jgi:hypothetical protein